MRPSASSIPVDAPPPPAKQRSVYGRRQAEATRPNRRVDPKRDRLRLAIIVVNHDLGGAVACKRALDFPDGRIYVHFRRIVFDCHVPTSLRIAEKPDHALTQLHPVRLQLHGRHVLMAE